MNRSEQLAALGAKVRAPEAARELLDSHFEVSPYQRIEAMRQAGERKAKAEGVCVQLEHQRHIVLATVQNEFATVHAKERLSEAKLERLARASAPYGAHIEGLSSAVEERDRARAEYAAAKAVLDWDRAAVAHLNKLLELDR